MTDTIVKAGRWEATAARLAVGFAVFLAIAEVARNWGNWGFWPFWLVDYIAVGLLLYGARQALRPAPHGTTVTLAGAWGFTCSMFYMSFFSHLEHLDQPDHGPFDQLPLTIVIGLLFLITIFGFALTLVGRPHR